MLPKTFLQYAMLFLDGQWHCSMPSTKSDVCKEVKKVNNKEEGPTFLQAFLDSHNCRAYVLYPPNGSIYESEYISAGGQCVLFICMFF